MARCWEKSCRRSLSRSGPLTERSPSPPPINLYNILILLGFFQILTSLADNLVGIISQLLIPINDSKGYRMSSEVLRVNSQIKAAIRQNKLEGIYFNLAQSFDQSFIDLAKTHKIDYDFVQPYIRSDSTHRQVQSLLGISRPITHISGHFTPLPLEGMNGGEGDNGSYENRPITKVEYRTGFDYRNPTKPDSRKNNRPDSKYNNVRPDSRPSNPPDPRYSGRPETSKRGKTIVPPWETEKK